MMKQSTQDEIWNRACLESGGAEPAAGDRALAALLLAHGLAMNGGVLDALENLSEAELASAIAGFNYFGLTAASHVFAQAAEDSDEAEERFDRMYAQAVPDDDVLVRAFRAKLAASPSEFAPVGSSTHV